MMSCQVLRMEQSKGAHATTITTTTTTTAAAALLASFSQAVLINGGLSTACFSTKQAGRVITGGLTLLYSSLLANESH